MASSRSPHGRGWSTALILSALVFIAVISQNLSAAGYNIGAFFRGMKIYRAIDFNGSGMTIDGIVFEAETGAAPNLTLSSATRYTDGGTSLIPATDADRTTMIRSLLYGAGTTATIQFTSVPNGKYAVYIWTWEDNASANCTFTANGTTFVSGRPSGAAGEWIRLGPWRVTVAAGTITLTGTNDCNFSGALIYHLL